MSISTQTPAHAATPSVATAPLPITSIPTPTSDKSTVTGVLKVNPGTPTPAGGVILYLVAILPEAKGTPYLSAFDRSSSPKTVTDPSGRFVFVEVTAAKYTLILDIVVQSYMLNNPKPTPGDFIIEAKAGQIVDLGDLVYVSLPGHGP